MKTPLGSDFESRNETSEIAAGVDTSTARWDAGVHGQVVNFSHSQPAQTGSGSSGGGSINYNAYGATVNPGTTSGDTAELLSTGYAGLPNGKVKQRIIYDPRAATPCTDTVWIGLAPYGSSVPDKGCYVDLTNGQYHVGATTAAAQIPNQYNTAKLTITMDLDAGETTFEHRTQNFAETVTVADATNVSRKNVALTESAGSGDGVRITHMRVAVES